MKPKRNPTRKDSLKALAKGVFLASTGISLVWLWFIALVPLMDYIVDHNFFGHYAVVRWFPLLWTVIVVVWAGYLMVKGFGVVRSKR